jgi:hypothetical protein
MGGRVEMVFELKTTCYGTTINYQLSQKLKLSGNCEFNHLPNILTLFVLVNAVHRNPSFCYSLYMLDAGLLIDLSFSLTLSRKLICIVFLLLVHYLPAWYWN